MNTETKHFSNILHENQNKNWVRAIDSSKIINWIDNLIAERRKVNQFYSKTDFIIELVDKLEKSYKSEKK